jgi:hypothetical protein
VTRNAGAMVKKSLSLFRERSFTCTKRSYQHSSRSKRGGGKERVNLQSCRGVRLHNFADVASELGERGADMAMFYDKRLGKVVRGGRRLYTLQVSAIFASASHAMRSGQATEPGRAGKEEFVTVKYTRLSKARNQTSSCYLHSGGCASTATVGYVVEICNTGMERL